MFRILQRPGRRVCVLVAAGLVPIGAAGVLVSSHTTAAAARMRGAIHYNGVAPRVEASSNNLRMVRKPSRAQSHEALMRNDSTNMGATESSVGQISATVGCFGQSNQMVVSPTALENPAFDSQFVAFQLAYTSSGQLQYTDWYGPQQVDGIDGHDSYFTGSFTTVSPAELQQITISNEHGVGGVWIRGAFWNGSSYEMSNWFGATLYSRFINGGSLGGSTAPCVMQ